MLQLRSSFSDVLLAKLKSTLKLDWLERAASPPKFDPVFLRTWATTMELKPEVFDSLSPLFVSQTVPDRMEVGKAGVNGELSGNNQG